MSNEKCSLCSQCSEIEKSINNRIISIADAKLYNMRFELNRAVDYGTYNALKFYKNVVSDICKGENCSYCYGFNIENILERARMLATN